jgi:hypothetical protein
MEGMSAKDVLENKGVRLLYFAVLLVLLVLVVWHLKNMNDKASAKSTERVVGSPLSDTYAGAFGYTNRFGQENTSTTVGERITPFNIDLKDMTGANPNTAVSTADKALALAEAKKERLSSMRENPVFLDYAKDEGEAESVSQFVCADGSLPNVGYDVQSGRYNLACRDGSNPGFGNKGREYMSNYGVQDALLGGLL